MMKKKNDIKWIMFDMGNVLVKYKPSAYRLFAEKHGIEPGRTKEVLFNDDIFLKAGRGEVMEKEFIQIMYDAFGLRLSLEEIVDIYSQEINEVIEGIEDLLGILKQDYSLSILSNTFFGHWNYFTTTPLHDMFDLPMASHLLGEVKPDEAIYRKALSNMKAKPHEVVFIDDLEENITPAKEIGIHAFQSLSIDDTKRGLVEISILDERLLTP